LEAVGDEEGKWKDLMEKICETIEEEESQNNYEEAKILVEHIYG